MFTKHTPPTEEPKITAGGSRKAPAPQQPDDTA